MSTRAFDLQKVEEDARPLESLGTNFTKAAGIIGLAFLAVSFFISLFLDDGLKRFMHSYLANYMFILTITLGGFFFVILQHITRAGWSVVLRRIAECLAAASCVMAFLFIPVLLGMSQLYNWTSAAALSHDPLLQWKSPYLNVPFFLLRCGFYFGIWWWLTGYFLKRSVEQDQSGNPDITVQMETRSAPAIILFALTLTFASFDFLMTLDYHWFSTIFGVYYFASCAISIMAFLIIIGMALQASGRLNESLNIEHYHDLGKLLFAFVFFWGYIAFSQYVLIWYGNIPEETLWFKHRQDGQWIYLSIWLIFGHILIPFAGLLSRYVKRFKPTLFFWSVWMAVHVWLDMYWLVMPNYNHDVIPWHVFDLTCLIGIGGLYFATVAYLAQGKSLIPIKDPRLQESLTFVNY